MAGTTNAEITMWAIFGVCAFFGLAAFLTLFRSSQTHGPEITMILYAKMLGMEVFLFGGIIALIAICWWGAR